MEIPLKKTGNQRRLVKEGLKFIRREHKGEKITMWSIITKKIQGFVSLGVPTKEVLIWIH